MKYLKYSAMILYLVLIILATLFLFTMNEFSNSTIGNTTILNLNKDLYNYTKGSLLISTKDIANIKENDRILYYDTNNSSNEISITEINGIIKTNDKEYTYVIEDGLYLSSEYLIGTEEETLAIPLLGYLYQIFTSQLGYFLLVIVPLIIFFLYQLKKYKRVRSL